MSADEIAIYRAFLQQYVADQKASVNVSATTFPLDLSFPSNSNGCVNDIHLENLETAGRAVHSLTVDVLPGKNIRLVDPNKQGKVIRENDPSKTIRKGKPVDTAVRDAFSTGLLSVSEIGFDKEHHFAVVKYSFRCGFLCGHGATLVFKRAGDGWRKTDRQCGGWIS